METEETASCSLKQTGEESASWAVDIGFKPGDFEDSGSGIYIVTSATFEKKKRGSKQLLDLSVIEMCLPRHFLLVFV